MGMINVYRLIEKGVLDLETKENITAIFEILIDEMSFKTKAHYKFIKSSKIKVAEYKDNIVYYKTKKELQNIKTGIDSDVLCKVREQYSEAYKKLEEILEDIYLTLTIEKFTPYSIYSMLCTLYEDSILSEFLFVSYLNDVKCLF